MLKRAVSDGIPCTRTQAARSSIELYNEDAYQCMGLRSPVSSWANKEHLASAPRRMSEEIVFAALDELQWRPFTPEKVRPDDPFQVDIWTFLKEDRLLVEQLNQEADAARDLKLGGGPTIPTGAAHGLVWTVKLELGKGLSLDGPATSKFTWEGKPQLCSFDCVCDSDVPPGKIDCVAKLSMASATVSALKNDPPDPWRLCFQIQVEALEDLYDRAAAAALTEFPKYNLRQSMPKIHQLIRDSLKLYRGALRKVQKEDPVATQKLLSMESKDRFMLANGQSVMISEYEAKARGNEVEKWEPLHTADSLEDVMKDAEEAHIRLKEKICTSGWAVMRHAGEIKSSQERGLVDWVDVAACPGPKRQERVEQKALQVQSQWSCAMGSSA